MSRKLPAPPSVWRPTNLSRVLLGVPHYPEHVGEDYWERDAERIAAAGFNAVRMGEFAWHLFEPRENVFDFSLFDRAIEGMARHGVQTIMCTPTATPPRWLSAAYPEVLRIDNAGRPMSHGSRQHADLSSPVFRTHSRRITRAMAQHYANNPNVIGWQTDNEFNTSGSASYAPATLREFQIYLRDRYGTIEAVNSAWGGNFWATGYTSFDEIVLPHLQAPISPSPGHLQDYHRFLAYSTARFQHEQVRILRETNADWFIYHNLGRLNDIDFRGSFASDLDFLGFDIYPFLSDESNRNGGAAYAQALQLDICRGFSGNFIVPEQQAGLGSQPEFSTLTPEPGEMRRMAYSSIARGADGIFFFRWRPAHFGAEIYWMGLIDHDDIPRRRYEEAQQFAREVNAIQHLLIDTSVEFQVGIAGADFDNQEAHRAYPMGLPSPHDEGVLVHQYCYRNSIACGFIHPDDDLSGLKVLIVPHWVIWTHAWTRKLEAFCERGGTVIVTARTGSRSADNHVLAETAPGAGLARLASVTVEEIGRLPGQGADALFGVGRTADPSHRRKFPAEAADRGQSIVIGERSFPAAHFYELLNVGSDATVLGKWAHRFMAGKAAISRKTIGAGQMVYVGTYLTEALTEGLLQTVFDMAAVKPLLADVPSGIEITVRSGNGKRLMFVINTNAQAATLALPKGADMITGRSLGDGHAQIEGYGCLILELSHEHVNS